MLVIGVHKLRKLPLTGWKSVMRILTQTRNGHMTNEQQLAAIQNMDQLNAKQVR